MQLDVDGEKMMRKSAEILLTNRLDFDIIGKLSARAARQENVAK